MPADRDLPTRAADAVGYLSYIAIAFLTPLAVPPPKLLAFYTDTAAVILAKMMVIRFFCALVMAAAAVKLARPRTVDWRMGNGKLPLATAACSLAALAMAALASPAAAYSLIEISTEASLAIAVLCAPLFLGSASRVRGILYAAALSAFCVAAIGLSSRAGFGFVMKFLYGADPFTAIQEGDDYRMGAVEGGVTRGPLMSTLANVEYAGSYMAIGFVLVGSWLLDGFGTKRHRQWGWWCVGTFMFATIGLAVAMTATRGAIVVAGTGLIVRWLASFRVRGLWIAAGVSAAVFALMLGGFRAAFATGALGLAAALAWQVRTGELLPRWRGVFVGTKALMLAGAALGLVLCAAAFVPGPWNKRSIYLVERLSSTSTTGDRSTRERIAFLMISAGMLAEHPVLGVGPGLFAAHFHEQMAGYSQSDATATMERTHYLMETIYAEQAHNDYFQIGAERGIVGLGAFLAMLTALFAGLVRVVRSNAPPWSPLAQGLACALGGMAGNMLTSFPLFEGSRLATFYMLAAAAVGLIRVASLGEERKDEG